MESNHHLLNVLIDHVSTKNIINYVFFNTTDLVKVNLKLVNVTNYLSKYDINVWYILGVINVVLDVFSRLSMF